MRRFLSAIFCFLLFSAGSYVYGQPLANKDKSGLYARSIGHVLRLDESDIDLATAVLLISEEWSANVGRRRYISKLDDMAEEILSRMKEKKLAADHRLIPVINKYLFDELGFKSVKDVSEPNDLFLHSVIDKKAGYCLSLSVLYLSIGERVGLPLYGVVVPGHFFVRYDDGNIRFNIETTSKGASAPDKHYIDKFNVPENYNDGIYLSNLTKRRTLGCFFNNLGNIYADVNWEDRALLALERAVGINPYLSESRINLGNIYLDEDDVDSAIHQYQKALKITADSVTAHNNLGNAYTRKGWFNDALGEYTVALKLDPAFVDTYKSLAIIYCKMQMFDKAIMRMNEAIILKPSDAGCYRQLADAYRLAGNYENAIPQYKRALNVKSNMAEAHHGLAVCYHELGETDDEMREYKRVLEIKPKMVAAIVGLGNAYFAKKQYNTAIKQYKKAIQITGDDAMIYSNLAAAYLNQSQYELAVGGYLLAVEINPEMASAHNGLAMAYYRRKEYNLAWEHIEIADKLGAEIDEKLLTAIKDKL